MAGDDHTTASCRVLGVVQVAGCQAGLFIGLVEDFGVFVLAHAAEEDNAGVGQHVLCSTGCVLCGTAGQQQRFTVVDEFLV